jgi:hypothetical protein
MIVEQISILKELLFPISKEDVEKIHSLSQNSRLYSSFWWSEVVFSVSDLERHSSLTEFLKIVPHNDSMIFIDQPVAM